MNPINFTECNVIYAKDQPEYRPLPALKMDDGEVVTCWKLSIIERLIMLFTGRIWLNMLTFNMPPQPILVSVYKTVWIKEMENALLS